MFCGLRIDSFRYIPCCFESKARFPKVRFWVWTIFRLLIGNGEKVIVLASEKTKETGNPITPNNPPFNNLVCFNKSP